MRDGFDPETFRYNNNYNNQYSAATQTSPRNSFTRSLSANNTQYGPSYGRSTATSSQSTGRGRARSGSLVTVTEVGGDEPDNVNDRLGVGSNHNAAWVNAPGKWKRQCGS